MALKAGGGEKDAWAGRLMEWREGGYNLGESYGFKALHFENQKLHMNTNELRITETGTRMTQIWRIFADVKNVFKHRRHIFITLKR